MDCMLIQCCEISKLLRVFHILGRKPPQWHSSVMQPACCENQSPGTCARVPWTECQHWPEVPGLCLRLWLNLAPGNPTLWRMAEFTASFLNCLADTSVAERMQLIFEPMFKAHLDPITGKMADSIRMLTQTVDVLKKECDSKDLVIRKLNQDIAQLQSRVDDLEQHGRKDSARIFGLSEDTPGTTDQKVLRLCNQMMKLQPPLTMDEIASSHRVGKVKHPAADGSLGAPRALLVKFVTSTPGNPIARSRQNTTRFRHKPPVLGTLFPFSV